MFAQRCWALCDRYGAMVAREPALTTRWRDLCGRCEIDDGAAGVQGAVLIAAYGEPQRFYHDAIHLQECLALVDTMADLETTDNAIAQFTLWFHDAVYAPTASDNESRSAAMAVAWLADVGFARSTEVGQLIEMTAGHVLPDQANAASMAVHDADLAILGADEQRYDEYARQIRLEYGHLSHEQYAAGRRKVLESFLSRTRIYARADIREARDNKARKNLTRELAVLDL